MKNELCKIYFLVTLALFEESDKCLKLISGTTEYVSVE